MNKYLLKASSYLIIFFLFFNLFVINIKVYAVELNVWDEIVSALDKQTKVFDSYNLFVDEIESLDLNSIILKYNSSSTYWRSLLLSSKLIYNKYTSTDDPKVKEVVDIAIQSTDEALESIIYYDLVFSEQMEEAQVESAMQSGDTLIAKAYQDYTIAVNLYNENSGFNSQQSLLYSLYFSLLFSFIFSSLLWFKSRSSSKYKADIIKAQIFNNLFKSSLWMLIGFAVTTVSLQIASNEGGSYFMFYGPVFVGGWQMLKGLWNYFANDRKILSELKIKDQSEMLINTIKG